MQDKKKKSIKARDLKPKKDAKGGGNIHILGAGKNPTLPSHQVTGPTREKYPTRER
jgi:hypothetical protein